MRLISIFVFLILCLSGCQNDRDQTSIDLKEREALEINDTTYAKQDLGLEVLEVSVDTPYGAEARTCFVYKDKIFYALDYEFFFQDIEWSKGETFQEHHNTQIRVYDMSSGEDKLIYQYDKDYCVVVLNLQYNGKILVWEEEPYDTECWKIIACNVPGNEDENIIPYILVEDGDVDGELQSTTPMLTEDAVLWYDLRKDTDYESVIYQYNFENQKITTLKDKIDTWTPYARVAYVDNVLLTYKYKEDYSSIFVEGVKEDFTVDTLGKIASLRGNKNLCVWKKSSEEYKNIHVYDIKNDIFYYIPTDYYFSFAVLNDIVIVNQENGIFAYDIIDKIYTPILECEGIYCGYIFEGWNCKYAFVNENIDAEFTVMIIK